MSKMSALSPALTEEIGYGEEPATLVEFIFFLQKVTGKDRQW